MLCLAEHENFFITLGLGCQTRKNDATNNINNFKDTHCSLLSKTTGEKA